ncbi:YegP family protein [Protaetiibacter sp. SSC-01]|uniref:YegP family protein n=1 Tax=Protaetiibacter sp. SSC-01 TaxID=2759943 RepID=UPI001656E14C|nr:YegP family protein [Protaetiibacter sp. SSC-01]QNO37269.1 YegP family protein [Protaetiibacter sp. SSC-01]
MRFQVLRSKNPTQPYFWRIVSESGQTVAVSGNYVAKASAIAMVQAVMRSSGSATFEDLTVLQEPRYQQTA